MSADWETSFTTRPLNPEPIIADLRPRLAERTAERDETVEQQTRDRRGTAVINSSPGDLPRPCGADAGQGDARVREVVAQVLDERDLSGRVESV